MYDKIRKGNGRSEADGRVAIVVGGAGGIGEATARMYAAKGAKVVIADLKDSCAEVAEALASGCGAETLGVHCDMTSRASVDEIAAVLFLSRPEANTITVEDLVVGSFTIH